MAKQPNIVQFCTNILQLSLSKPQAVFLKSLYGLPLSGSELGIWTACTGRQAYPAIPFYEATEIVGARGGKDSRAACPIALYEATLGGHEKHLARGEQGVVAVVSQDARANRILLGYLKAHVLENDWLRQQLIEQPTANEIKFKNRMEINAFPCTYGSVRGWSMPVGIMCELGFWSMEGSANSDVEIQQSIKRGGVGFPNAKLLKISTPYMRSGILWDDFRNHFGTDSRDLLVWRAASTFMNPSLNANRIQREERLDPIRFEREYMAEFIDSVTAFLPGARIDAAVKNGRSQLQPRDVWDYISVIDQSGLRADEFVHTIFHAERDRRAAVDVYVQDYVRSWRATGQGVVDLDGIIKAITDMSRRYNCNTVIGDQASESWVQSKFSEYGMGFQKSQLNTNECYLNSEIHFLTNCVELLDDPVQARQFRFLEKIARPGGKSAISHPRNGHDDMAAAACRAIANLGTSSTAEFWAGGHTVIGGATQTDLQPMDRLLDEARASEALDRRLRGIETRLSRWKSPWGV